MASDTVIIRGVADDDVVVIRGLSNAADGDVVVIETLNSGDYRVAFSGNAQSRRRIVGFTETERREIVLYG